ncbi:hypothetical protein NKJ13_30400 [Mesorhizobium sp. M0174]|uniref:hypothetical protein n=1 Tax=Mesorhizobium sp. M0174 TaxID=2956904 RepID=UPI00333CC6CA
MRLAREAHDEVNRASTKMLRSSASRTGGFSMAYHSFRKNLGASEVGCPQDKESRQFKGYHFSTTASFSSRTGRRVHCPRHNDDIGIWE